MSHKSYYYLFSSGNGDKRAVLLKNSNSRETKAVCPLRVYPQHHDRFRAQIFRVNLKADSYASLLKEGTTSSSSALAWRIPWTEEPGGLQSRGHKEWDLSHDRSDLACMHYASQNTYRIYTHILWQEHAFIKEERII